MDDVPSILAGGRRGAVSGFPAINSKLFRGILERAAEWHASTVRILELFNPNGVCDNTRTICHFVERRRGCRGFV